MTPVGRATADIEEGPENALRWPSGSNKWSADETAQPGPGQEAANSSKTVKRKEGVGES